MSRKKQNIQKTTALYCRLSLEDGRENESMSISNQKLMLKDFAEKNGMFRYEYYVDDGYTGRNFNRPAFQRMIADIEAGKNRLCYHERPFSSWPQLYRSWQLYRDFLS